MNMSRSAGPLAQSHARDAFPRATCAVRPFPIVILGDDAVGYDCDHERMQELLNQLSAASKAPNAREAMEQVLRQQTVDPSLCQAEIFLDDGPHKIHDTIAVAAGAARVEATGSGILLAVGKARARVRNCYQVWVTDDVYLEAYDNVRVDASGSAHVYAYNNVVGIARDKVQGTVNASKSIWAIIGAECFFDMIDGCTATVTGGTVRAYGRTRIHGDGKAHVILNGNANGWLQGDVEAQISGNSIAYTAETVRYKLAGTARRLPLMA
jgi:hypothetical protein